MPVSYETLKEWASRISELRVLEGHNDQVWSVCFSPDGRFLATGSDDMTVRLWKVATGRRHQLLEGHNKAVQSVCFSPDGQFLASGSDDKTIGLWEVATGRQFRVLEGHRDKVWSVCFSPDGRSLASGLDDKTIRLWEVRTGRQLRVLEGHKWPVYSVCFSPDGRFLATGSNDMTVRLWEIETGRQLRRLEGHSNSVTGVCFSPDGRFLATGSDDKTVQLWNVETGRRLQMLEGHSDRVQSVCFSSDGRFLASGSRDRTIRLWEVETGYQLRVLKGHSNLVTSVCFSPDGRFLASGSGDRTIRLWDTSALGIIPKRKPFEILEKQARKIKQLRVLEKHRGLVRSVDFAPDGRILASGSVDKTIRLWEARTGRQLHSLEGHKNAILSVVFSPDGRFLASGSGDNTARLWEVGTGRQLQVLEGHTNSVTSVCFSSEGQFLASGSEDTTIRLWTIGTNRQPQVLEGHSNGVTSVCFSPEGWFLASGSRDKIVRLWEVETGRQLRVLKGHSALVMGLSFSSDGRFLASGSFDSSIRIWEVETGRQLRVLEGHGDEQVWSVCFSPDGHFLASGSEDKTIGLWDVETDRQLQRLKGHRNAVSCVCFSPDGQFLASGSGDKTVRLWDLTALEIRPKPRSKLAPVRPATGRAKIRRSMHVHLLTLPLSHVIPPTPSRPASWLRGVGAMGVCLPLCIAQDLGTLLTQPRDRLKLARPDYLPEDIDTSNYLSFLERLSVYPLLRKVNTWDISDALVGVVLARLAAGVKFPQIYAITGEIEAVDFARQIGVELDRTYPLKIWRETEPAKRPDLTKLLPSKAMAQIETNLRKLDADELRFLHHYGPRFAGAPDPRELLDLFTLLALPPAVRLALSQVLQLLPRVSQAACAGSVQPYSMGGYEGLTHKGNLDSLVPTELAYPKRMFLHRLLNREALYYGREGYRDRQRELAYIITQAGLELLGDEEVLARALTLALAQTMRRRGYEVQQSFVGSECTSPTGMNRPADIQFVLYYRDKGWLHTREMLEAVSGQLRAWGERYRGMQVFWVVGEHWDTDEWKAHVELYQALKQQAGQQAWFIRAGQSKLKRNGEPPAAARQFYRHHVVDSEIMWTDERN